VAQIKRGLILTGKYVLIKEECPFHLAPTGEILACAAMKKEFSSFLGVVDRAKNLK